jgi:hypothetical protein
VFATVFVRGEVTQEFPFLVTKLSPCYVLADWVKVTLTLPDPPPDPLVQLNDVAILSAISVLTERLSPEAGTELRKAPPQIQARIKAAAG